MRKVDIAIELLYTAVARLKAYLNGVHAALKNLGVIEATRDMALYGRSLDAVKCSLQDCEHTLRAFSDVLPENRAIQKRNTFLKAMVKIKLNLSKNEMKSLRSHIQDHSISLRLAMHTLME